MPSRSNRLGRGPMNETRMPLLSARPESVAAMGNFAKGVKCADLCQCDEFLAVEYRDAVGELVDAGEWTVEISGSNDCFG